MNNRIFYFLILYLFQFCQIFAQADVALSVINLTPVVAPNDSFTFIITLYNEGKTTIKDIKVEHILPYGISYISHFTEGGTYDPKTQIWNVTNFSQNQKSISMTLVVKVLESLEGTVSLFSEIISMSEKDIDSIPGNGYQDLSLLEDDIKFTCISVPLLFDIGSKINVTINANNSYTNYEWFKNGKKIDGATDSSYIATDFGYYTLKAKGTKSSPECELILDCPFVIAPRNN